MSALCYLFLTSIKNRILNLRKRPALLVCYAIGIAVIVFYIIGYTTKQIEPNVKALDIRFLYLIIAGLGIFYLLTFGNSGLQNGGTIFTMADVALLFNSPISSKKILIYALLKQLGTTFLTSIFIVFQIPNLVNGFGITKSYILVAIFAIYAIILFNCQLVSMGVYIFTNMNEKRKKAIKLVMFLMIVFIGVLFVFQYLETRDYVKALLNLMDLTIFGLIPIAGWSSMLMRALVIQNYFLIALSVVLFLIFDIIIISLLTAGKADYYEDVLSTAAKNHEIIQAAREGKRYRNINQKVKVKKNVSGINKGQGASAIFYRQILEQKKKSKLVFLSFSSFVIAALVGIFSLMVNKPFTPFIILAILSYISLFVIVFGNLAFEIKKPITYLIPDSSIKKVFYSCLLDYISPFVDGILLFTVAGIILRLSPLFIIALALSYGAICSIYTSVTLFWQRYFGVQLNKALSISFELLFVIIMLLPGLIVTVVIVTKVGEALWFLALLPIIISSILISALLLYLSRDIFNKGEIE